jgi:predicted permease
LFTAGFSLGDIEVAGTVAKEETRLLFVGPDFFATMQIPVLLGREIDERDHLGSPEVAVVSELFAKTNFGRENSVGSRLTMKEPDPRDPEIVGVVKDARYGGLKRDLPPVVYMPYDQGALKFVDKMTYAVRTSGNPLAYANTIREIVHQADARVPVANMITQEAQIDQAIHQEIAFAKLCTTFALLALVIACVGLYGTVAYNVARRTSEIGIRIALGARRSSVVFRALREVFVLAVVGLAISVPAAVGGATFVESFLFGMKPNDPLTAVLAVLTLLAAALAAAYVPAWKASRIDPMTALRHE